jgi:hypothetical protein
MPWLSYFLNYPCNKKWPKNISAQNVVKKLHDFFGIFKNFWHWKQPRGCPCCPQGNMARPPPRACQDALWVPQGPTHLVHKPSHSFFLKKNHHCLLAQVLAHFHAIFYLLAQNSVSKTVWGDCSLVCDSFIGPISFCSSGPYFAYFATIGDHENVLACLIYLVLISYDAWYSLYALVGVVAINYTRRVERALLHCWCCWDSLKKYGAPKY